MALAPVRTVAVRDERTRRVLDTANEAFVGIDHQGRIADWNSEAGRLFGWRRDEAIGRDFRETIVGEGDALRTVLATGEEDAVQRRIELLALHREGHEVPVEMSIAPLVEDDGMTFSVFAHDITERRRAAVELARAQLEVVERLARAAEYRDDDTGEHIKRVGARSAEVAAMLGLPSDAVEVIGRAAPLHDVGKIGIPDAILLKPGSLTETEFELVKTHTVIGARLLSGGSFPLLDVARDIALFHHERWDGSGYPYGLAAEAIPLVGRIVAVVDVFDALTHERPYKHAWSIEEALAELHAQRGRQLDPHIVEAFASTFGRQPTTRGEQRASVVAA